MKRVVVAIYIDPDFYPPTINAILNLAETFDEVVVVTRNNSIRNYPFPANVILKKVGKFCTVRESEQKNIAAKIFSFIHFSYTFLKNIWGKKTKLVLLYDAFPLFSFYLVRGLISKKKKIWYHNHDMPSREGLRKYSIGWLSATHEHRAMRHVDFFSLPSVDRLAFYPALKKEIPFFNIPNYPSIKVYRLFKPKEQLNGEVKIIFQGFISDGHSLEEMVELLQYDINGKKPQLILKGSVKNEYKEKINSLALKHKVADRLTWVAIGPYSELQMLTASCHIGNAIQMNRDNVSRTLGTASNKIYEYAASGLPVILYDIDQFKKYLDKYSWTFFSDGSKESLKEIFKKTIANLPQLQLDARRDFENELNFEHHFKKVMEVVNASFAS